MLWASTNSRQSNDTMDEHRYPHLFSGAKHCPNLDAAGSIITTSLRLSQIEVAVERRSLRHQKTLSLEKEVRYRL
jgi:hypothetical protein